MKFTQEEKELIAGMLASQEWAVAMKAVAMMIDRMKVRVLTTGVESSGREIVLRKAKLEGAIEVQRFMDNIRSEIKKEGLDG